MYSNTTRPVILACTLLLAVCQAAVAEEKPAEQTPPAELEPLIITSPLRSPGQSTWRTEDLAAGRETGDLLREITGVSGSRMGGHGIDPVIRGLGMNRINVLLDGAFVHGACPNRMDPPTAYAPAAGYDSLTVIRGVNTLEFGGGPGGTVLLERDTERFFPGEPLRARLHAGYRGNSDTVETAVDVAGGRPQGFVRLLGSWMEADDYQDGDGNRVRSGFEERSAALVAGWTPEEETRLEFSLEAQRLRDELFAGAGMDSPSSDNDLLKVRYRTGSIGPLSSMKAELAFSRVDHVMDNYTLREPPSPMMLMRAPATSDTDSGRVTAEIEQDRVLWRFGFSIQNNQRDADRVNDFNGMLQSVLWPGVRIDQTGAFIEGQWSLAPRQRVIAGLRHDRVRFRANRTDEQPGGQFLSPNQLYAIYYGEEADGRRGSENNLSFLLRYEQDMNGLEGTWHAGLSRSFRTADATERYIASNAPMPSGRWVGNPTLSPERHDQAELGLFLRHRRWDLDASLFVNDISDFILRDRFRQPGNNATVYRNVSARLWGGELGLARQFASGWRTEFGLAYVRANNRSDDRPIAQTPPLEAMAGLAYRAEQWTLGLTARAAARQRRVDDDPMTGSGLDVRPTPGWAALSVNGRYHFNQRWQLDAGIDNLLDRLYAEHLNRSSTFDPEQVQVNEPGRSAWLRVSARW